MSFIQFESGTEKERIRQELKNVREELLNRAQKNAEARASRALSRKLRGDDTWMLPSVLDKIKDDTDDVEKSKKSSKKSKKEKKSKKGKKDKKSKKKKYSSSDSDSTEEEIMKKKRKQRYSTESSSASNSSDDNEWVEKSTESKEEKNAQPLVRDDWMTSGLLLKTYSKEHVDKKEKERQNIDSYNPSKSTRELNPYWKDGGTGLPTFQKPKDDDEDDRYIGRTNRASRAPQGNWRKKTDTTQIDKESNRKYSKQDDRSLSPSCKKSRILPRKKSRSPSRKRSRSPPPQRKRSRSPRKLSPSIRQNYNNEISSASSSDNEQNEEPVQTKRPDLSSFLTDQQMNELGAKLIKAEIMGNSELAKELSDKLKKARELRNDIKTTSNKQDFVKPSTSRKADSADEEHVLLTTTDSRGVTRPLSNRRQPTQTSDLYGGKRKKNRGAKTETHVSGERVRYFPDDDRFDIKQMFEREKYTTAADSDAQFAEIAGKQKNSKDDLEDIFADKVRRGMSDYEKDKKEKDRAIREHEQFTKMLDNCNRCFDSAKMEKELIVCMGLKVYISLPWYEGLQPGHCLISPIQHVSCSTELDEDTWMDIRDILIALTRMFESREQHVVFFETARYLNKRPHMVIHCVPSKEFEIAPFYFKKAIEESEYEWSTNKQLVTLKEKDLQKSIPKGLPYFWVHFGIRSGFAHVIEDQERFPSNFAEEILGGILNLDARAWRKPRREFNPIPKVKQFAERWKDFDCTRTNKLDTKLTKAEIMESSELDKETKDKLKKAWKLRDDIKTTANKQDFVKPSTSRKADSADEEHVLLTTTDSRGVTRPLSNRGQPTQTSDLYGGKKEKGRAIREHEQFTKMLDNCNRCFDSAKMEKELIVCMGLKVYISLPWYEGLQPGHCLISPIQHVSCSTELDEDTWMDIRDILIALTRMFESREQHVVFFETARYLNKRPHMVIHCVPSKEFEKAPFYFKKAIEESKNEWSTNKQLVTLEENDLQQSIPKGLPYFWVHFGIRSGFAHVIEDQERFPSNFAEEILGGILNLDARAWRKPRREINPIPKVKQFAERWKDFDCTRMNKLDTKLSKAEIMESSELDKETKDKLKKAWKLRDDIKTTANKQDCVKPSTSRKADSADEEHVLLTTTDSRGVTRPLSNRGQPTQTSDLYGGKKEKGRAIREHEQFTKMLDNCNRCFDSAKMEKELIVCMGLTVYISLPWHEGLQPGHCLISPIQHVSCSTELDEDTWMDIRDILIALTRMFESREQHVVFFETARYLNKRPHMVIHCVPSKEFEKAPFYFKKAIEESKNEWSTNKQLVTLEENDLQQSIPKGLPYFWVHFGIRSGFAHVIEDQERFPSNFAEEILGGILNLDARAWRKPRREINPIPKVKQFAERWKDFDCTRMNKLDTKLSKAEIMESSELDKETKDKLKKAWKLRDDIKTTANKQDFVKPSTSRKADSADEEHVLLTTTDSRGLTRP